MAVESLGEIKALLRSVKPLAAHKIVGVVEVLVANVLCSRSSGDFHHCAAGESALPVGSFGGTMSSNRITDILQSLHFSNNLRRDDTHDKVWKLPKVIQVI